MIQPQWPGLGPSYPPAPFSGSTSVGADFGSTTVPGAGDGVRAGWWNGPGLGSGYGAGATTSSMFAVLQSLVSMLGQLVNGLMGSSGNAAGFNGAGTPGGFTGFGAGGGGLLPGSPPAFAPPADGGQAPPNAPRSEPCGPNVERCAPNGERFRSVTISSTGDPHIAETGTRRTAGGDVRIDEHYDSMTSHADLADARSAAGGYRVATSVTQPAANGVTYNQSASVTANAGRDIVTMNRDGSIAITSDGEAESIPRGGSLTLSGGESVTENEDGSLAIAATNARGGSISTTLQAQGRGVDVTVRASNIAVGGDVVGHDAGSGWETPVRRVPVRDNDALDATTN